MTFQIALQYTEFVDEIEELYYVYFSNSTAIYSHTIA